MSEVLRKRSTTGVRRKVPVAWEALEDAFENNAPEVHSYLSVSNGEVVRVVDGVTETAVHARIASDPLYVRVEPVSSREQYRWMERFIETVDEPDLRGRLERSIDGKGALRRSKDALMAFPVDRERWFTFRSERLRVGIQGWLEAHDIDPGERPEWRGPTADEVKPQVDPGALETDVRAGRAAEAAALRVRLRGVVDRLAVRDLELAVTFLEFLGERRHRPRTRARGPGESAIPPPPSAAAPLPDLSDDAERARAQSESDPPARDP